MTGRAPLIAPTATPRARQRGGQRLERCSLTRVTRPSPDVTPRIAPNDYGRPRRGAGAVERGGLENRKTRVKPLEGSNPSPAAGLQFAMRDWGRSCLFRDAGRNEFKRIEERQQEGPEALLLFD